MINMKFDNTITLGNIIAAFGFILSCITIVWRLGREYSKLEKKIDENKSELSLKILSIESKVNMVFGWWEKTVDEVSRIKIIQFFTPPEQHHKSGD